jgi:pilus assembly protein CpaC
MRADFRARQSAFRCSEDDRRAGASRRRALRLALLVALPLLPAASACEPGAGQFTLRPGTALVVDCPAGIARVAISAPEILDAVTAGARELLLEAKGLGQSTLVVWSRGGERTTYNVTVEPNWEPLRQLLRETFPGEELDIRTARDTVSLVGRASSQAQADRALALVAASVKGAVSNLQVAPPAAETQILLRIRFAELDRTAIAEFGVNLLSTGAGNTAGQISTGGVPGATLNQPLTQGTSPAFSFSNLLNIFAFNPNINLGLLLQALQQRNLLQMLAEPNLVTTNGKEASFLAGGEIPVPVVQSGSTPGAISVQYKEYGIRLSFLPWVTTHQTIRLHVKPEVSSLDPADGVEISGFIIPALTTRRVETDVELAEGQSFVIGGLVDDQVTATWSQIPGLAHIPLLGALFKSRSENKTKTELIVVVTPEVAAPLAGPPSGPAMPEPFLDSHRKESKP